MSDDIRTLAEHRAAAENTNEWISTDVDFSNDGETWARFLLPTDEHPHPLLARATVARKGKDDVVQTVLIWDEAVPDDGFETVWQQRPHLLFGAAVERAALRRAFPAALAGLAAAERDIAAGREPWAAPIAPAPEVSWEEQVAAASTPDEVDAVHAAARERRQMTPALEVAMRARKRELAEPVDAEPSDATAASEPAAERPKRSRRAPGKAAAS